jgi:hypothetical protein
MQCPKGSAARAYTDDLGPDPSGGFMVSRGSDSDLESEEERERSQSLIVRSKEPEATHPWVRQSVRQRT